MPGVTVSGVPGVTTTIPFTSSANTQLAQAALLGVTNTFTAPANYYTPASSGVTTVPAGTSVVTVTVSGGYTYFPSLPATNQALIVSGSNNTVSAIGSNLPTTVIAGSSNSLVFLNNNTTGTSNIFLGGGNNYVSENTSVSSAVINVDGSSVSALDSSGAQRGGGFIDGSQGSTTINLFNNAFVHLVVGGNDVVTVGSGAPNQIEVLGLSGSTTVAPTITAQAGSTLYIPNDASAFIAPGAGNVVLFPGNNGTDIATLFGGTGSDTVFSGSGFFQGGSAGNNIIQSGTVSGATTIVGCGNNDYLASWANNNTVIAGAGNETLAVWNSTGNYIIGGSGTDTLFGSITGQNNIGFGSGSSLAYGQHGASGTAGNTFFQDVAGGTDTIGDFLPGQDVFSLALSSKFEGHSVTTTNFAQLGTNGTTVTLSDGSTINFLTAKVSTSDFS